MGASVSSNSVNSMIQNAVNVANNVSQICTVAGPSAQTIISLQKYILGTGGQINIFNDQTINQTCLSKDNVTNNISTSVSQAMRQTAEATVQQFAFGTVDAALEFINASITLGDTISSVYTNHCTSTGTSSGFSMDCKGSIIDGIINFENYQTSTQNCILNASEVNNIKTVVISKLSQSAIAQQEATFFYFIFAFVLLIGIMAWFVISTVETPAFQWGVVLIVLFFVISSVVYTLTAKSRGSYPYRKAA